MIFFTGYEFKSALIVVVLPLPVWPYAKIIAFNPFEILKRIFSHILLIIFLNTFR